MVAESEPHGWERAVAREEAGGRTGWGGVATGWHSDRGPTPGRPPPSCPPPLPKSSGRWLGGFGGALPDLCSAGL